MWVRIDTETLVYGGEWDSVIGSIRAKIFGQMVELSKDRIKYYRSDLYHDAIWLQQEFTTPGAFEWIARESGTHIGEVCKSINDKDWPESVRYRFVIRLDDHDRWVLDTYMATMDRPHTDLSTEECDAATTAAGCIYHPADIAPKVEDPVQEIIDLLFEPNIPTLRNDLTSVPNVPNTRKENKMDDILRDLRYKYEEASNTKDQLEEYQGEINNAIEELDTYMADLDDLINSLDSVPEVSIYVDLSTVDFDS